jgi:hypothetical protein
MPHALILLALIPFALIGACIAIRLAWALVPYAAAGIAGLVTAILMVSPTAVMEPPMFGVMEPATGG